MYFETSIYIKFTKSLTCCNHDHKTLATAGSGGGGDGVICRQVTKEFAASLIPGGDDENP